MTDVPVAKSVSEGSARNEDDRCCSTNRDSERTRTGKERAEGTGSNISSLSSSGVTY